MRTEHLNSSDRFFGTPFYRLRGALFPFLLPSYYPALATARPGALSGPGLADCAGADYTPRRCRSGERVGSGGRPFLRRDGGAVCACEALWYSRLLKLKSKPRDYRFRLQ